MCAKIVNPFLSMDASGTFGGSLTATKWKGRNVMRQRVIPANPRTDSQTGRRALMAGLVAIWKTNVSFITANWETLAKQQRISTFNAFTGFNAKQWTQLLAPANSDAPDRIAPLANASSVATTIHVNTFQVTWTDSTDPLVWAYAVFVHLAGAPTYTNSDLKGIVVAGVESWVSPPLPSGDYQVSIVSWSTTGGASGLTAAVHAIIP